MSTPPDQMPPAPPPEPPAAPPVPPPEPPPAQPPAAASTDDRNLAMLTHLSGIVFGFIVPLVVWLVNKDSADKHYLNTEAKEALNFQLAVLIAYIICMVLTIIVIGVFLFWLVWLANVVFCVLAAVEVNKSGSYRYPFTLRLLS
ncbi:MAG TPA: DUF4870 domain-containing protein [Oleiagrimonas sp.]|nr:DUF4870 domain-containing protein [Oleiagrimonas sp.]